MKSTKRFASMFVAGALALSMGVSAVAAPCVALAQGAQEQQRQCITRDEAIWIALEDANVDYGITRDMVHDLAVTTDGARVPKEYRVTFYIEDSRTLQRQTYDYRIDMHTGRIKMVGVGSA